MTNKTEVKVNREIKPYLDEIAERLWTGHATLMVGAGFSKNAAPVVGGKNQFPDWNELCEIFFEKVNGQKPSGQIKYLNPLKPAEEVEVLFGRETLNTLLKDKIPDDSHKPTELFTKLLELEWRDVFTTNFDTLLERAKDEITERSYQVVVKKEDIINSKAPRIIKLHGSFPSNTPFIITEEDYRTYPEVFAPFVNTVHQALLETTLCLIGFSGEDPNFLKWIGWIRDQFEHNITLKMYLIGSMSLSESQLKFLDKRNVNIVDLGNCQGVKNPKEAIERFVNYLKSKKNQENRLDWPNQIYHPSGNVDDESVELRKIVKKWKSTRENFPRWRIVPRQNRFSFYFYQKSPEWVSYISENLEELNQLDFQFVYEYCWLSDKFLLPIWDDVAALAENCLSKIRPTAIDSGSDNAFQNTSDGNTVKEQWLQISVYLLRYYREEGLHEKWHEFESNLIEVLDHFSEEQRASLYYERCLQRFFQLDILGLEDCLNSWPTNRSLPFFEAKRAGLLAEIGRLDEAKKILEESLETIRKKQNLKPISNDYKDASDDAYVMLLLRSVKQSLLFQANNYSDLHSLNNEYTERFNYFHQFKCDPFGELSHFRNKLNHPFAEITQVTYQHLFRIGYVTTAQQIRDKSHEVLTAYSFLRFCEEIGLPFRLPHLNVAINSAKGSLTRIGNFSPHWALITLIRTGDEKVVKQIYNRKYVYTMSPQQCDNTIDLLLNSFKAVRTNIATETSWVPVSFSAVLVKILPVIVSRLCCKASLETKKRLVDFIVEVYSSEFKSKFAGIADLVKLLFDSFSTEQQIQSIPKLLYIPIPENIDWSIERNYPNPFRLLKICDAQPECRNSLPDDRIAYFINKAKSKEQKVRDWAIYTLFYLELRNLLTEKEKLSFVKVAWGQTDRRGFPYSQSILKHHWLRFASTSEIDVGFLLKDYVYRLLSSYRFESSGLTTSMGKGEAEYTNIANELVGAQRKLQFDSEIYVRWLERMISWWESDKRFLNFIQEYIVREIRIRFSILIAIISGFILPNLTTISNDVKKDIEFLISDFQSYQIPTAYIKVASIKLLGHK